VLVILIVARLVYTLKYNILQTRSSTISLRRNVRCQSFYQREGIIITNAPLLSSVLGLGRREKDKEARF
jgi:hypothetical protein